MALLARILLLLLSIIVFTPQSFARPGYLPAPVGPAPVYRPTAPAVYRPVPPRSEFAGTAPVAGAPAAGAPGSPQENPVKDPGCKLGASMNLILATGNGSCQAPDIVKGQALGGGKDICGDSVPDKSGDYKSVSPHPLQYNQAHHAFNFSGNEISFNNLSTDCSGLCSAVLCRGGLNPVPGDDKCAPDTTAIMKDKWASSPCFEKVTDGSVKVGDFILTEGHVKMVSDQKGGDLRNGTRDPKSVVIAHASGTSVGVVKANLTDVATTGGSQQGLAAKRQSEGGPAGSAGATFLRHVGDRVQGCVAAQKRVFKGEEQFKRCPNLTSGVDI